MTGGKSSDSKKENLFAKLAVQNARAREEETAAGGGVAEAPPSPALLEPEPEKPAIRKKKAEPVRGKRDNPDYCQANAYIPKKVRKAVDRELLDIEGMDYSSLVEELLRKWLKGRGASD